MYTLSNLEHSVSTGETKWGTHRKTREATEAGLGRGVVENSIGDQRQTSSGCGL